MKLNLLYFLFALALGAFLLQGSSQGRANVAGQGNCGAPGDDSRTCITCHERSSSPIKVDIAIEAKDAGGNIIGEYIPGDTYDLSVIITPTSTSELPGAYGFQMVCLNADKDILGTEIPGWSDQSNNARIVGGANTSTGRTYVEQAGPSTDSIFTVKWTAPDTLSGVVTFYSCGNGVNQNNGTSGDGANCITLSVQQNMSTNANEVSDLVDFSVGPNPAVNQLQVRTNFKDGNQYKASIFDMAGQLHYQNSFYFDAGTQLQTIDISHLARGMYIIRLTNGKQIASSKWVKQ